MGGATEEFHHRGIRIHKHRRRWRWRARTGGEVVSGSGRTLEEAVARLDTFLDARAVRNSRLRRPREIHQLCLEWLRSRGAELAPATLRQYEIHIRVHIAPGIGRADANVITPQEITEFYRTLRWKSAKEAHHILRQSFDWGLRNGTVARESNPCLTARPSRRTSIDNDGYFDSDQRIRPVEEKDVPTATEVDKLLVDAASVNEIWWLYLKFATTTGARPGEICALRRRDIDLDRLTVRIEWTADRVGGRLKRPKTPAGIRTLQLPEAFFEAIAPYLPADPDAFLFPSNTQPGATSPLPCWNSRSINRRLDNAIARTGIKHITPHALRHFVATQLLAQGLPTVQVARFLGHENDSLIRSLYANHIVDEAQRLIGEAAAGLTQF